MPLKFYYEFTGDPADAHHVAGDGTLIQINRADAHPLIGSTFRPITMPGTIDDGFVYVQEAGSLPWTDIRVIVERDPAGQFVDLAAPNFPAVTVLGVAVNGDPGSFQPDPARELRRAIIEGWPRRVLASAYMTAAEIAEKNAPFRQTRIEPLEFWDRFTAQEQDDILDYPDNGANPQAKRRAVRRFLHEMATAKEYIDLDAARTVNALDFAEAEGLIAAGRGDVIRGL